MRITVMFWCLFLVPCALAQDIVDCSEIESDEARLACYDEAADRSGASGAGPPSAAQETPEPAAASAADPDFAAEPVSVAAPAPEPIPAAPAATPEELFGKSEEEKSVAIAAAAGVEDVTNITGAVTRVIEDPYGKKTIDLDNGQRWRQVRAEPFKVSVGDEVVISRAIMRSFNLQRKSGGRKTKVRRVN